MAPPPITPVILTATCSWLSPSPSSAKLGSKGMRRTSVPSALSKVAERRVLTTLSIISLCYFNVCGGPIGSEEIVTAGGPLIGIISIFVMPLIWSIPVALVTTELSTAFPTDGGYTVWVYHAFGAFLAFQEGFWSWIGDVVNGAVFPGLLLSTITEGYGEIENRYYVYAIRVAIALVLAAPSLFRIKILMDGIFILSLCVLVPFTVFVIWGIPSMDFSILGQIRHENMTFANNTFDGIGNIEVDWSKLANTLFWNFNGFHGMSVVAGEVDNPNKVYPVALCCCVFMVIMTYLLPLSVSAGINDPSWTTWNEGSFGVVAHTIGGGFLRAWIVASSVCSGVGMYMTKIFISSFELLGMAECNLVPRFLGWRHPKYDTPQIAVATSMAIILILIAFEFDVIVKMTNVLACMSVILIMTSAIKLRCSHPNLTRPFKIHGGLPMLAALTLFPVFVGSFIVYTILQEWILIILYFAALGSGIFLYFFQLYHGGLEPSQFLHMESKNSLESISDKVSFSHEQQLEMIR